MTGENGKPLPGVEKDGNISFDELNNPVSVNNAFFTSCVEIPCNYQGLPQDPRNGCPAIMTCDQTSQKCNQCRAEQIDDLYAFSDRPYKGNYLYDGNGGATAWLTTTAPVIPGEIFNLDFYLWDTGDHILDSTVILDNFQWRCDKTDVSTGFATGGVM